MNPSPSHPELDTALRTYLQAAFDWLRSHHPDEHLYAVGLGMVEEKARSELGMVKPNEMFVQITQ